MVVALGHAALFLILRTMIYIFVPSVVAIYANIAGKLVLRQK